MFVCVCRMAIRIWMKAAVMCWWRRGLTCTPYAMICEYDFCASLLHTDGIHTHHSYDQTKTAQHEALLITLSKVRSALLCSV